MWGCFSPREKLPAGEQEERKRTNSGKVSSGDLKLNGSMKREFRIKAKASCLGKQKGKTEQNGLVSP